MPMQQKGKTKKSYSKDTPVELKSKADIDKAVLEVLEKAPKTKKVTKAIKKFQKNKKYITITITV